VFTYQGSVIQNERLAKGADHCGSEGMVFALRDLIKDGQIMDPRAMAEPLTAGRTFGTSAPVLIYAVDTKFSIHVGFDGICGQSNAVKHETLFHNADVRAAGDLEVFEGMIVTVNDHSGSYGTAGRLDTDRRFAEAVLTAIDDAGAPVYASERVRLRSKAGRR